MLICHANVKFDLLPIITNGDARIYGFRNGYAWLRVVSILITSEDFEKFGGLLQEICVCSIFFGQFVCVSSLFF